MSKSWLSIFGLYQYDNTLFDEMRLPEGVDKELVIDGIIQDCMELELLFPDLEAMRYMIKIWSRREMPVWLRVYNAERLEYNPIENYDRFQTDNRQTSHSGDDVAVGANSATRTGESDNTVTESRQNTIDTLHKYSAFDSGTMTNQTEDIETGSDSISQSNQTESSENTSENTRSTFTHGEKIADAFTSRIHGNIGVTTSQQMLESEMNLAPKLNTVNYIINSFKMHFCILVY